MGKRISSTAFWAFFIVITLFRGMAYALNDADSSLVPVLEKKSMVRSDDMVMLRGDMVPELCGSPIDAMALFAWVDSGMQPVPFQVDEVDPKGEWVLTMVPPAHVGKSSPERDSDDGALDANDEIVFMLKDAGERVTAAGYPAGATRVIEIRLADPIAGGCAWIYLAVYAKGKPPRSARAYVAYDVATDRFKCATYEVGFPKDLPIAPGYMTIMDSPNILDRLKIRLQIKVAGMDFNFDETNFVSELSLYKAGPIRVIRRTRNAMKITSLFQTPSIAIENILSAESSSIPIKVVVPISLKTFSKVFSMLIRGGSDFQNTRGWFFTQDADPRWFKLDGRMDETERGMRVDDVDWFIMRGPQGALLCRIVLGQDEDEKQYLEPVVTSLYYVDNDGLADPPENVPGQSPNVAFWVKGFDRLGKGRVFFNEVMYSIPDYSEGAEKAYLDIIDRPVAITVLRVR